MNIKNGCRIIEENEEYYVVDIPGKHGIIHLHVPKREATQEEIDEFYTIVAEVAINSYKNKQAKRLES